MSSIVLPESYVEILAVSVIFAIHLFSLGIRTGMARGRAGLQYPYAYADKEEAAKNYDMHLFNCYQRAHQNALEEYPVFLTLLLVAGLTLPRLTAGVGIAALVARELSVQGYYTGDPDKRNLGHSIVALLYGVLLCLSGWSLYSIYTH